MTPVTKVIINANTSTRWSSSRVMEKRGKRNSANRIERSQNRQQPVRQNQPSRAAKQRQKHAFR